MYGGPLSALSIRYDLTPVGIGASVDKQLWKETETIFAIYEDRQELLVQEERLVEGSF